MIRRLWIALCAGLVLVLTACAGLPTSSDVQEGRATDQAAGGPDFAFIPDRPQPGATPEQIVEGFLRAGSGPADNWSRALEFLTPAARAVWNPDAGVTIAAAQRQYTSAVEGEVSVDLTAVATVDERGSYEWADGAATTLPFELERQADGEWRIAAAPDGVVLDREVFPRVFHRYALMYFDPSGEYLVPDIRWFPRTNQATRIVDALVNDPPSDWLAASVETAFPEGVSAISAVPVVGGLATVALSEEALAVDQRGLDRMQTQLEASLATAGIAAVEMLVATTPLPAEAVPVRRTAVSGQPLVLVDTAFGFLAGDELTPVPGLSPAVAGTAPTAVQVSAERSVAAAAVAGGAARVLSSGEVAVFDEREGVLTPGVDAADAVWSGVADDPAAMVALLPDGELVDVAGAWPGATRLHAFSISRDGTRIVATVTTGSRTEVWVAGIVRDGEGAGPLSLGEPQRLGTTAGVGAGIAWIDDLTVGILIRDQAGAVVLEQPIGGPGLTTDAPEDAVSIAGANTVSNIRLRGADGALYLKRGANWQQSATGIDVLATQQGTPE